MNKAVSKLYRKKYIDRTTIHKETDKNHEKLITNHSNKQNQQTNYFEQTTQSPAKIVCLLLSSNSSIRHSQDRKRNHTLLDPLTHKTGEFSASKAQQIVPNFKSHRYSTLNNSNTQSVDQLITGFNTILSNPLRLRNMTLNTENNDEGTSLSQIKRCKLQKRQQKTKIFTTYESASTSRQK